MSELRRQSSEALYRIVNNSSRPDWIRREALEALIEKREIHMLERIVNNANRPDWIRKMALEGIRSIK